MPSLTTKQHQYLLNLITERMGERAEVAEDGWSVTHPQGGIMGLVNISRTLSTVPEDRWPEIVSDWIDRLASPPTLPATFDQARAHLRIRLSADGSQPGWASHRPVCDGLDQLLMIRTELGAVTVSDEQLAAWGADPDIAWKDALEHTIWDEARERRILARGRTQIVWVRDNFFASSVLLDLRHLLSPWNRFGAVVMVPVRDALLYAEILDDHIPHASADMIEIGGRWYVDEPGQISPDLFWYRTTPEGGSIDRLVRVVDSRYEPCWGPEFSAALAELSADLGDLDSGRRSKRRRSPTMPR
ncbi:MAG: hypothetical protein ACRDVK_00490 [Acidimicrobiia bacterium]